MSNVVIGIVARDEETNDTMMQIVTKNNLKYLHNKCDIIGILNYDNNLINPSVLSLCDGIIFQGGSDIHPYHFQILDYAIKNNIPVLGICMGQQIIGLYSLNTTDDKNLIKVAGHHDKKKTHLIKIIPNTILYKIFGPTLTVNTRHKEALKKVNKPFIISALSEDNIIEAIEYIDDNHFVLGVQFHPEDLDNTESLYNYFLKEILKRKK